MPVYYRSKWGLWLQVNKPAEWNPGCRYPAIAGPGDNDVTINESTCPPDLLPLPTVEEVNGFASPLTDVDRARQYAEAYAAAEQIIFLLMGRVAPALVVGGFFTPETVNAEGTRFMAFHRDLIIDFKNSGRHPDAGTALYNAIAATPSTTAFPWLLANGGAILAIFGNGLPRNA